MPMTEFLAEAVLNQEFGATAYVAPATQYVGLLGAATWTAATVYTLGTYVVGTAFNTANRHIYKCTVAGTSAGTEPAWNQGAGAATVDNTATWTEVTDLFAAGTISGAELSASGYARVAVTNNVANFPAATPGPPSGKSNGSAIVFPTPTTTWLQAVASATFDALTAGNMRTWSLLTTAVVAGTGSSPSFAASALSFTLA